TPSSSPASTRAWKKNACGRDCSGVGSIYPLIPTNSGNPGSVRHATIAANVDARGGERPVRLLGRGDDREGGASLDVFFLADLVAHDRRVLADDDLLLAVLVLHEQNRAVDTGDDV